MSKEIQRMFLAGSLIAIILFGAQFFFGNPSQDSADPSVSNETNPISPSTEAVVPNHANKLELDAIVKDHVPQKEEVVGNMFHAEIDHNMGGSFISYKLTSKNPAGKYEYVGSYIETGVDQWVYSADSPVSLIQENNLCAPCVYYYLEGEEKEILAHSWALVRQQRNTQNNSVVFEYELKDELHGERLLTKTVEFNLDGFEVTHSVQKKGGVDKVSVVWENGIRPAEKNLNDEKSGTYSFASIGFDNSYEYTSNNGSNNIEFRPNLDEDEIRGVFPNADWVSIRNKYFTMSMIPIDDNLQPVPANGGFIQSNGEADFQVLYDNQIVNEHVPLLGAGLISNNSNFGVKIYFGPLDIDYISELSYVDQTMSFGPWGISFLAKMVLSFAKFLHGFGIPYGFVLIILALLVRVVTGPLTKKSHESTQKMQAIQPEMKKLQKKYKDDSQKLNQEMIKLYQQKGVNPVGGCLPMLIQMPLLFALFMVFRATIELRGVSFFFGLIENLAAPDYFIEYPAFLQWWPIHYIYGSGIAFLPLLLGVTMFMSQQLNAKTMDSKQKPMMYMMTAFFFLIFNNFPSGLNLYYLVYNILNYLQQRSIKKTA